MNEENNQSSEVPFNYSFKNLPPSVEVARLRLLTLESEIIAIEYQLGAFDPSDFENEETARWWKKNALKAAGYKKQEISFVTAWIKSVSAPAIVGDKPYIADSAESKQLAIGKLREFIMERMAFYRLERYTQRYSESELPETMEYAKSRRGELVKLVNCLLAIKSEVKRKRGYISQELISGISKEEFNVIWQEVQELEKVVLTELRVVNSFIADNKVTSVAGSAPKPFKSQVLAEQLEIVLNIAERLKQMRGVTASGESKLTPEELKALEKARIVLDVMK